MADLVTYWDGMVPTKRKKGRVVCKLMIPKSFAMIVW